MLRSIAIKLTMFTITLLMAMNSTVAQQPISNYEHLREFGEFAVGRWIGVGTLSADLPGLGNEGEKVNGHALTSWILDKNAIECNWNFGAATGKWIAVWDAAEKKIKRYGMSSTGGIFETVVTREGDKWVEKWKVKIDGQRSTCAQIWTSSDGGKTITIDETDQLVAGTKRPDLRHVWSRIDK
jgi:hypothetical protein